MQPKLAQILYWIKNSDKINNNQETKKDKSLSPTLLKKPNLHYEMRKRTYHPPSKILSINSLSSQEYQYETKKQQLKQIQKSFELSLNSPIQLKNKKQFFDYYSGGPVYFDKNQLILDPQSRTFTQKAYYRAHFYQKKYKELLKKHWDDLIHSSDLYNLPKLLFLAKSNSFDYKKVKIYEFSSQDAYELDSDGHHAIYYAKWFNNKQLLKFFQEQLGIIID